METTDKLLGTYWERSARGVFHLARPARNAPDNGLYWHACNVRLPPSRAAVNVRSPSGLQHLCKHCLARLGAD
jgi:hypothetical protein